MGDGGSSISSVCFAVVPQLLVELLQSAVALGSGVEAGGQAKRRRVMVRNIRSCSSLVMVCPND